MRNYFIRDFPGSPEVKIPHVIGSILGQGTKISRAVTKKRNMYMYVCIYIYMCVCVCVSYSSDTM